MSKEKQLIKTIFEAKNCGESVYKRAVYRES